MHRVKVEFRNHETRTLSIVSADYAVEMAEIFRSAPNVRVIIPEINCPEHGWSAIEAGHCAECLDEYYHPQHEEECV